MTDDTDSGLASPSQQQANIAALLKQAWDGNPQHGFKGTLGPALSKVAIDEQTRLTAANTAMVAAGGTADTKIQQEVQAKLNKEAGLGPGGIADSDLAKSLISGTQGDMGAAVSQVTDLFGSAKTLGDALSGGDIPGAISALTQLISTKGQFLKSFLSDGKTALTSGKIKNISDAISFFTGELQQGKIKESLKIVSDSIGVTDPSNPNGLYQAIMASHLPETLPSPAVGAGNGTDSLNPPNSVPPIPPAHPQATPLKPPITDMTHVDPASGPIKPLQTPPRTGALGAVRH